MKVSILGAGGDQADEGMKKFSRRLNEGLKAQSQAVQFIDLNQIFYPRQWHRIRSFSPDIVHLVPGPSTKSLGLLAILDRLLDTKTVATALRPTEQRYERWLRVLAPDFVFVQSKRHESVFRDAGCKTAWLVGGVDTATFKPVDETEQRAVRNALNFPQTDPVFLHVGHLNRGRNIKPLTHFTDYGHVVVVGSPSTTQNEQLIAELQDQNVQVIREYIENIEHYYQAADYYVFPTVDERHCIQIPLSVLEAMACDCPVLTTRFGGLPALFDDAEGVKFIDNIQSITPTDLEQLDADSNRELAENYSWNRMIDNAIQHYTQLCQQP